MQSTVDISTLSDSNKQRLLDKTLENLAKEFVFVPTRNEEKDLFFPLVSANGAKKEAKDSIDNAVFKTMAKDGIADVHTIGISGIKDDEGAFVIPMLVEHDNKTLSYVFAVEKPQAEGVLFAEYTPSGNTDAKEVLGGIVSDKTASRLGEIANKNLDILHRNTDYLINKEKEELLIAEREALAKNKEEHFMSQLKSFEASHPLGKGMNCTIQYDSWVHFTGKHLSYYEEQTQKYISIPISGLIDNHNESLEEFRSRINDDFFLKKIAQGIQRVHRTAESKLKHAELMNRDYGKNFDLSELHRKITDLEDAFEVYAGKPFPKWDHSTANIPERVIPFHVAREWLSEYKALPDEEKDGKTPKELFVAFLSNRDEVNEYIKDTIYHDIRMFTKDIEPFDNRAEANELIRSLWEGRNGLRSGSDAVIHAEKLNSLTQKALFGQMLETNEVLYLCNSSKEEREAFAFSAENKSLAFEGLDGYVVFTDDGNVLTGYSGADMVSKDMETFFSDLKGKIDAKMADKLAVESAMREIKSKKDDKTTTTKAKMGSTPSKFSR